MLFFSNFRELLGSRALARVHILLYAHARTYQYAISYHTMSSYTMQKCYNWLSVTYKESAKILKKVARKFGQFIKKQYLCNRFAPEVSELRKRQESCRKIVTLRISNLWRKCKEKWKKLLENLVSPKKSSTFTADFALNEKWAQNHSDLWEIEAIMWYKRAVMLNWETENV